MSKILVLIDSYLCLFYSTKYSCLVCTLFIIPNSEDFYFEIYGFLLRKWTITRFFVLG